LSEFVDAYKGIVEERQLIFNILDINVMINWIVQNKEWLFSGGGITVLTIAYWVFMNRRNASADKGVPQVIVHVHNETDGPYQPGIKDEKITSSSIERISRISYEAIRKALDSAPPLQQEDVKKHFVGINVEWDAVFKSATKADDEYIDLFLEAPDKHSLNWITCRVRLSEYRELGVLPKNAKIRIHGEIENIETLFVSLTNVKLFFYD
jgi:hypothetical protein